MSAVRRYADGLDPNCEVLMQVCSRYGLSESILDVLAERFDKTWKIEHLADISRVLQQNLGSAS